jgi:endonuclease-3
LADREYMPSLLTSSPSDIYKQWGYRISDNIDELTKLPGVGVKTAKVVLHCLYDQDVIAVDTHVHRVSNRL